MFRFEHPEYLFWLLSIPALLVLLGWAWRRRQQLWAQFGKPGIVLKQIPGYSKKRYQLKSLLLLSGLTMLFIAWANPQWGSKKETVERKGIDLFIAMDISNSMLAEDIAPSRLERAKRLSQSLIDAFKGNRIGLIFFAGNAYLQMPLTTDYAAAEIFIQSANTEMAATQGTAIGDAIDLALQASKVKDAQNRMMVILSDGENHDELSLEKAGDAADAGMVINTVGFGTTDGGLMPWRIGAREDFKRDETGTPIRTRIDEEMLEKIAAKTLGIYSNIQSGDQAIVKSLLSKSEAIEKSTFEQQSFTAFESYFQYFLLLGLLFLFLDSLFDERRSKFLFGDSKITMVVFILVVPFFSYAQSEHSLLKKGDRSYKSENFATAEESYRKAIEKKPETSSIYNLGNAIYRQNRMNEATQKYEDVISKSQDAQIKSKAFHNLGNAYFQQKQYDKSIEAYKNALRLQPDDLDTKQNLALARRQYQQQQKQQQQQENKEKDNKEDQSQEQPNSLQKSDQQPEEAPKSSHEENQNQEDQQKQPQKPQNQQDLSKKEAEKLLKIMDQEEQKVQEKLQKAKGQPSPAGKDW